MVSVMILTAAAVVVAPVSAFKVYNVNLHRLVDLPAKTVINRTTITDQGKCSWDTKASINASTLDSLRAFGNAIQRENIKDIKMSASDITTILAIPPSQKTINSPYKWCGLDK